MTQAHIGKPPGSRPSAGRSRALADLGLACERLRADKVGFGVVVWLAVTPGSAGVAVLGRASTKLPPASTRGLRIGETGHVPEIQVENQTEERLLLPAHLVLSGGWQTRAVERSVIVDRGGAARVPVKCVEAGRWAPRDERTAASFEVQEHTALRTRWSTSRSMAEQRRATGRYAVEQSALWQHVDEELTRSPMSSRTRSYEAYLRGVKQAHVDEARKAGVRPPPRANAALLLPRGGGFWVEAYPTDGALAERADELLADLFDEAAAGPHADVDPAADGHREPAVAPAVDADELLAALWEAEIHPIDRVAGTLGDAYAIEGERGPARDVTGAALMLDGALAHLAVGAPPRALQSSSVASGDRRTSAAADRDRDRDRDREHAASGERRAARPAPAPRAMDRGALGAGDSGPLDRPRVDLETMRLVYGRARDLMPEEPPARERVQGYRLVRVLDRNISWVDVRIGGDGYAVLGSHDRCDLVLSSDSGIWLRHMAAICVRLDDDSVGLRLIDLKTDLPFFLEDDTPRWSVIATGAFAMRIGRHVVCGFPIGPLTGDEPRQAPPQRAAAATQREADAMATGILDTGALQLPEGTVAPARAPAEITSFLPSAPVSQIQELLGPSPSPEHVRVTLERGGMGASVELPTEALDAGILLGRALNCFDGGLRRIFCEAISRAHVLVLRDHRDVYAYDLCSTNGTRVAGQRIRRHRLSDAGTTLELGKKVVFRWRR